jgi:hypothetical protein
MRGFGLLVLFWISAGALGYGQGTAEVDTDRDGMSEAVGDSCI